MNFALCLRYYLEEIISQASFINSISLLRLVYLLFNVWMVTNPPSPYFFFLIKLFADEMCLSGSVLFISQSFPLNAFLEIKNNFYGCHADVRPV